MENQLTIFEGEQLEILTKEDVNFEFNGDVLFNGKQIAMMLEYKNDRDAISKHTRENQRIKVKNSDVANHDFRKLNNAGETFLTEKGVMKLIINSDMPKADEFEDKVWNIVETVRKTGKFDSVEEKIKTIEDEKERRMTLSLYTYEQALKINPKDMLTAINYSQTKQELELYKQQKQLENINHKVEQLEEQSEQIKKATVLREGDLSAETIARKFNIFSINNKPHNRFADYLAKEIGFYRQPSGEAGYQDDFISINLENKFGTTTAVIKYSQLAVDKMREYIDENGLNIEEPAKYFKKGEKKGNFNFAYINFESGERIKVNQTTYQLYSKEDVA
jgi:prophage antirepressor-like protein